ncbi:hypothetical protein BX616_008699 [Lobosporangium transversale]|nr:hypothetical protein BX616_008699 [Lobosporangium transversale]
MPKRGHLPPQKALDLATLYLEQAHKTKDPVLALEICLDAENALYRIQRSDQKSLVEAETRGTDNADKALCKAIATTLSNLGELFGSLGYLDHSKRGYKYATRWGHVKQGSAALENTLAHHRTISIDKGDNKDDKDYDSKDGDNDSSSKGRNSNNDSNGNSDNNHSNKNAQASANTATNKADNVIQAPKAPITHNIINIPQEIFSHDIPRVVSKYSLPSPGTHLSDTQQLAYSLSLLPTAPILKKDRSDQEQEWYLARSNDRDEQERLHSLASDVITMFICDPIKAEATVAEVVLLAPVLDFDQYRTLLMAFINGVDQDILLKTHLLEGLAPLMQYAPPGYLDSDDLINILDILSSRLQDTHAQSGSHIYQLCVAVSHVLDAMVRSQVKGLKREQLQEPLAAYLKELKDSSDPHLVYYAAYASQALLYIPNDETTMQAMLRRTSVVAQGVFGVVSAVKDWDLDAFMDELVNIQKELPPIVDVIEIGRNVCDGVVSLYESGMTFKQSMEEGLAFICKSAWYPALCEADAFLHSGELTKFKALVCEAPCRRDLAFQWGICLRLGQIAANPQWAMHVRQDAINLLGDIYKNDKDWSDHAQIKQWIITILKRLISLPKEDLQGE